VFNVFSQIVIFLENVGAYWNYHVTKQTKKKLELNMTLISTKKLNYRKDNRAMRPMYGCPETFRQSLSTPTATFPERPDKFLESKFDASSCKRSLWGLY